MKGKILATAILALLAVSTILTVIPSTLAATTTLGQSTAGSASTALNTILGTRFTTTTPGQATSINAYLSYSPTTSYFGQQMIPLKFSSDPISNNMRGQEFTSPPTPVIATSISAYIDVLTLSAKNGKAAIYDANGHFIVASNQKSMSVGIGQQDFTLTTPTPLSPSTKYIIVVFAQSAGFAQTINIAYNNDGGNGRQATATYGTFPSTVSFNKPTDCDYFIWCNYQNTATTQCAIYSADGTTQLGVTEQKTYNSAFTGSWVNFNLNSPVTLASNTQYILAAYSSDSGAKLYYNGAATSFKGSGTFSTATLSSSDTNNYNLYTDIQYNTITASAGAGGTISPSGAKTVAYGASQSFSITPSPGYHVTGVTIDGTTYPGEVTSYNFPSVTSDHTIVASFAINQVATTLTVACTPDTVDRSGTRITTVSGTLTTSLGAPIADKQIALTYNDGTEKPIATVTTQADGSYSYTWTAPSGLPNGFYRITAAYTGDNNPYQSSTAMTAMGGGGLFVVPEYALGALGAVFAMFAAFGIVKVRHKRN